MAVKRVTVRVKPGSRKGPLVIELSAGELEVYVPERAVDGAANQAVVRLLAGYFNLPKSRVRLARGIKSRHKIFELSQAD